MIKFYYSTAPNPMKVALCLEEMLDIAVPRGAIYYHATRRREEIIFDSSCGSARWRSSARFETC